MIVAGVNNAGDLYYFWQPDGTTTWNQELVATGQGDQSPVPSIAWTGTSVVIADTGSGGGQLDYYYQYADTRPWYEQQVAVAPEGTNYGPATISWTGSAVIIAAVDLNDNNITTTLDYWYQYADTQPWYEQQVATGAGYSTYVGPSIGWTGSTVIITDGDTSGNLDYWYQYADTETWHEQQVAPGNGTIGLCPYWCDPVIGWTGSAVIIAATDVGGDLYYWYQPVGTGTWHQQEVAAGAVAAYYNPAIAWTGSSVVLAGVSANGSLNFWWQAAGTSPWHEEHVATFTPDSYYFPPSIATAGGSVVITDTDGSDFPGGNLDYCWQQDGTSGWNQELVAAG